LAAFAGFLPGAPGRLWTLRSAIARDRDGIVRERRGTR
jgi:hypothetical protein